MDTLNPWTDNRPWGNFREFTHNLQTTVKVITVNAGGSLSLQKHNKRSEFWRVLSGEPEITIDGVVAVAKKGDEFTVPVGAVHRLAAPNGDVEILEIGLGEFDEADIVRLEDKYGRT